jgi:hypothetical protein
MLLLMLFDDAAKDYMLMMMWVQCCYGFNVAAAGAIIRFDAADDAILLVQC